MNKENETLLDYILDSISDLYDRLEQIETRSGTQTEEPVGLTFWDEPELPFSTNAATWPSDRTGGRLSDAND